MMLTKNSKANSQEWWCEHWNSLDLWSEQRWEQQQGNPAWTDYLNTERKQDWTANAIRKKVRIINANELGMVWFDDVNTETV